VVQLGEHLGFPAKTPEPFIIVRHAGGQDLERYIAAQFGIRGAIHLSHAAGADGRQNLVEAETSSAGERHTGRRIILYQFRSAGPAPHSTLSFWASSSMAS